MNGRSTAEPGRHPTKQQPVVELDRSSIGPQLRAAREARGWDLDHIESLTKVRAGLLAHLENGDFDRLPEPIYTQSYLKSYAQAVGLPLEPLMEAYRRAAPKASAAPSQMSRPAARPPVALGGWLLGALAALGIGAYVFLSLRNNGNLGATGPSPAAVAPAANPSTPEAPSGNATNPGTSATPDTTPPAAPETVTLSVTSTPPGATVLLDRVRIGVTPMQNQPVTSGPGRELRVELEGYQAGVQTIDLDQPRSFDVALAVAPKPATAAAQGGAATGGGIVLTFSGPSWVRVTDATGRRLFEGTPKAGETKTFTGPVTVRAGRPDLVSATVGGQAKGPLGTVASPATVKLP